MSDRPCILAIDDEPRSVESLARILEDDFEVLTATDTRQAEEILKREWVQVVLCDQRMPDTTGVEFLTQVREQWPDVVRMIISGYTDSEDIINGVNEAGIYQYITKPWHPERLVLTLSNAARLYRLQRENQQLSVELKVSTQSLAAQAAHKRARLKKEFNCEDGLIRGPDSPMAEVCRTICRVAPYDVSVLLTGESGTGKELCARALHYNSPRGESAFVVENCGALPDDLLESELFGYKKGAFTGAYEDRMGLFEQAHGGSIFLDEIGEVSPAFQVKLLRVLQEGEVRPLGSSRRRKVDVRVIAATNRDLEAEVRAGRFREDLFYRLTAITVQVPALRYRAGDIAVLAQALLEKAMRSLGKQVGGFSAEAMTCLQSYPWPGNVRELQNEIQRLLVFAEEGEELSADKLSPRILRGLSLGTAEAEPVDEDAVVWMDGSLKDRLEAVEERILRETLIRHRWNRSRAANELGISRVGLRAKMERFGLEPRKH